MHYKYSISLASNWFVTLYCKLHALPPLSSASEHGRQRSNLLLYSISMHAQYLCVSSTPCCIANHLITMLYWFTFWLVVKDLFNKAVLKNVWKLQKNEPSHLSCCNTAYINLTLTMHYLTKSPWVLLMVIEQLPTYLLPRKVLLVKQGAQGGK